MSDDRQLPAPGEIFLDHVAWMVPDMDAASAAFTRLGFPLTPYSVHGDRNTETGELVPTGSSNRLAMLPSGYLEILTAVEGVDTDLTRHLRSCVARHVGVHLVAFTVADAEAESERLKADGFEILPTVNLRRTIEAEDGSEVEVAFTVIRARFGSIPEGRIQTIAHHTPEHMWQGRYIAQDNGIHGLTEVVFAVDDPAASAGRLARFTQRPSREGEAGPSIALDRGRLRFLTPDAIAQAYDGLPAPASPSVAALAFSSADMGKTRAFLDTSGIRPLADAADRIVIGPDDGLGVGLVVSPRGSDGGA